MKLSKKTPLHFVEHPAQNRIRQFDAEPGNELILSVNVTIENGDSKISEKQFSRLAAEALRDVLNNLGEE